MFQEISRSDFVETETWCLNHLDLFPPTQGEVITRVFSSYTDLLETKQNGLQTLQALRQAMGITPKSEKGSQLISLDAI